MMQKVIEYSSSKCQVVCNIDRILKQAGGWSCINQYSNTVAEGSAKLANVCQVPLRMEFWVQGIDGKREEAIFHGARSSPHPPKKSNREMKHSSVNTGKIGHALLLPTTGTHESCLTGDSRANEHLGMVVLHTLFLREHNRLVKELHDLNPHWSPNTLYQEARKIVGAIHQVQHFSTCLVQKYWQIQIICPVRCLLLSTQVVSLRFQMVVLTVSKCLCIILRPWTFFICVVSWSS